MEGPLAQQGADGRILRQILQKYGMEWIHFYIIWVAQCGEHSTL